MIGWGANVKPLGGPKSDDYYLQEVDDAGNFYGDTVQLNNTGWGDVDPWTEMANGCIAWPFAWDTTLVRDTTGGAENFGGGFCKCPARCAPFTRLLLCRTSLD